MEFVLAGWAVTTLCDEDRVAVTCEARVKSALDSGTIPQVRLISTPNFNLMCSPNIITFVFDKWIPSLSSRPIASFSSVVSKDLMNPNITQSCTSESNSSDSMKFIS